jgi:tetratricopeptide (TPR) repeat protein
MALFAELRVLLAEKNEAVALQVVEGLVAQYPKQLSNPDFKELSDEIAAYHGFLLADAGRWTEALALLEAQTFPLEWRNVQCYFLGRCYFEFGDYERARKKLIEALDLGLIDHWASKAHFTLGATEYRLGNMSAAKKHFELYLKTAPADSLSRVEAWEWLEMTCRALRLYDEAEQYGRIKKNGASAKTN